MGAVDKSETIDDEACSVTVEETWPYLDDVENVNKFDVDAWPKTLYKGMVLSFWLLAS